jgi:hypothetical protein
MHKSFNHKGHKGDLRLVFPLCYFVSFVVKALELRSRLRLLSAWRVSPLSP